MIISIIAAMGKNNELGKNNQLLWHLPKDMKHFKDTTTEHAIIMGRKTFEALGRPLSNRQNIIITRNNNLKRDGIEIAHSLTEAIKRAKGDEVFIIGGGEIYKQALELADKLYITHVDAVFKDADTFFPEIVPILWNEVSRKECSKDDTHKYNYVFSVYEKFI